MTNFSSPPQPTFKFFYIGSVIAIIGLGLLTTSVIASVIFLICGIFVLLSISGVIVNIKEKKVKSYHLFLFLKIGKWINIEHFTHLVIGPNSSSQAIGRTSTTFRTNSYSVSLLNKESKLTELKEFTDLSEARKYLTQASNEIGLPIIDKLEIIKERAASKRSKRK
ncbi:MAG: hypothetical protein MK066_13800 [Crocinitomicaceae bacterium]|nr:hypothetical protein [Crocinitomicaceae bacterium]